MPKGAAPDQRQSKADDESIDRETWRSAALATTRSQVLAASYFDNDVSVIKPRGPLTAWGAVLPPAATSRVIGVELDRLLGSIAT